MRQTKGKERALFAFCLPNPLCYGAKKPEMSMMTSVVEAA